MKQRAVRSIPITEQFTHISKRNFEQVARLVISSTIGTLGT